MLKKLPVTLILPIILLDLYDALEIQAKIEYETITN